MTLVGSQLFDTMKLLAEAYTVNEQNEKALEMYQKLV